MCRKARLVEKKLTQTAGKALFKFFFTEKPFTLAHS